MGVCILFFWNYLRVRGEYNPRRDDWPWVWELPPRARRIHLFDGNDGLKIGTTSACAENTGSTPNQTTLYRNYLRVRGEYCPPGHLSSAF